MILAWFYDPESLGPVSLENVETIFKSYQEQKYLAGLLALVSVVVLVLVANLLTIQRAAAKAQERQAEQMAHLVSQAVANHEANALQLLAVVNRTTEAIGASTAGVSEVRRSSEATTAEVRAGFGEIKAEMRLVESALKNAMVEADRGREVLKDHMDASAAHIIDRLAQG